ncbi:glutamate--tRNA ligase [Acidiphilium sp. AL]|uniref:Glutamate--tRNA ligase n=1 Tax=Acidiphilium iwatense TaxID=768198 RepID=A0ABS9E0J3_9PROT|nr:MULTISPECIES: glutamate--tRNA ligase [Acidiphilium]MCF3948532.1 glutamate--tRNA ligase [Acidiphilium iwatense]MCU4160731.1 glutamate--tRNA ligase [Acidiphilium sp. AL]
MVHVRFAPSPTGYLHAGNARQAVVNYLFARAQGGRFLLRIDDTDTERSRPEYEAAIEQDLRWLGIEWDSLVKQSDRLARYAEAADRLKAAGLLYPCFESEEELAAKRAQRAKRKLPPIYDRAMLKLTPEQRSAAEANGKTPYWRFKLSDGAIAWGDLVLGRREVRLNTLSDPVLIRADNTPLYTFTSVVDDLDLAITHIIRGEDHVTNTVVQIDLLRALAPRASLPVFAHLPLISDAAGDKLSKRAGSISLRTLRRDGIEARALAGYLARLGSRRDPEPLTLAELAETFDLADFSRGAPRFDPKQLLALNRKVLHGLSYADVASRLPDGAGEEFWMAVRGNLDLLSEARNWWEVVQGGIDTPNLPEARDLLTAARDALPPEPWDETTWKTWTTAISAATGARGKSLYMPLRLALTGESHGPELAALLPLIGRPRALARLNRAAG